MSGLGGLYHVALEDTVSETLNRILRIPFSKPVEMILNSPISPLEPAWPPLQGQAS